MTVLRARWSAYVDRHHRYPTGVFGRVIGERMRRQHMPETEWSVGLLQLQPTDRVLEIGFGVGCGLTLSLQRAIQGHVTGMDLSATMIRAASRRNRAALAHGQLALLRGDVAQLPFGDQQFDKILSIHTFYFWPDTRAICQQLIAMLAPVEGWSARLQLRKASRTASACIGRFTSTRKRWSKTLSRDQTLVRDWQAAQTRGSSTTLRS